MTDVDDWSEPYHDDLTAYLEAKAEQDHLDESHGGGPCDCPSFDLTARLAQQAQAHRDEVHGGGACHCPPEEAPF